MHIVSSHYCISLTLVTFLRTQIFNTTLANADKCTLTSRTETFNARGGFFTCHKTLCKDHTLPGKKLYGQSVACILYMLVTKQHLKSLENLETNSATSH